ncbi:MAG: sigma-54 dependent transcriptional regulator [Pseudomonadota bacterium]
MQNKRALIVDDEPDIRELLEITLGRMKLETVAAADLGSAHDALSRQSFDLCLTDMHLPDGNGLELVEHINLHHPDLPVAMITAFGSMDTAIAALKAGAFDFVQKPIDLDQLRSLVESALKIADINDADSAGPKLLGSSAPMEHLRSQIKKLARSQAPIYISGESGSGKEVAARQIHALGPRNSGPFVPVNCGAIPTELMESEFFGHVKGSFTGAVSDKQGLFQAANAGTLFLDEVADLPLSMQVKLLRAIQEKAVRPIGSQSEDVSDIRILSATHKDLAQEVARGRFRQDLYYRLNVIELRIPPLREHPEDLTLLAEAALARLANEYGGQIPTVSEAAMQALQAYAFPGNIRELENVLERAFTLCENNSIEAQDLQLQPDSDFAAPATTTQEPQDTEPEMGMPGAEPNHTQSQSHPEQTSPPAGLAIPTGSNLEEYLENIERDLITQALEENRWNKTAAAKSLGITFRALRYKLKKLEME